MAKKSMTKFYYLINSIAYYVAWIIGIKLAANNYPWLSTCIVIIIAMLQIYWRYNANLTTNGLWHLLGSLLLISTLTDTALVYCGFIVYAANPFSPYFTAPWMVSIWINFVIILYIALYRLFNHLIILSILSFLGFFITYNVGKTMGAVFFPYGYTTCFLVSAIWMILLPCTIYYYNIYHKIIGVK